MLVVSSVAGLFPAELGNSSIAVNRVEKAGGAVKSEMFIFKLERFFSVFASSLHPPSLSLSSLSLPDNCVPSPGCVVMIAI